MAVQNLYLSSIENLLTTGWDVQDSAVVGILQAPGTAITRIAQLCGLKGSLAQSQWQPHPSANINSIQLKIEASTYKTLAPTGFILDNDAAGDTYSPFTLTVSQQSHSGTEILSGPVYTSTPSGGALTMEYIGGLDITIDLSPIVSSNSYVSIVKMWVVLDYTNPIGHREITLNQGRINLTSGKITIQN